MKNVIYAAAICSALSLNTAVAEDRPATYKPDGGYVSTTNSTYVEPSAVRQLKPGQKISNRTARNFAGETMLQRLTERSYWVQSSFYNTVFYVGDTGVLVMDPLAFGSGKAVLAAIGSVTKKPVRAVIYSHHHEDHIGDIGVFVKAAKDAGVTLRIIATSKTAQGMKKSGSKLPQPTEVLEGNTKAAFDKLTIQVTQIDNPAHTYDSAAWKLVEEDILHIPDHVNPDEMPYLGFGGSQTFSGLEANLEQIRKIGFRFFSGGHGDIGSMADFDFMRAYITDLKAAVGNAFEAVSPGDYFVKDYNNHQASADAWNNAMTSAAMDALRPKYGEYYGFEASVPYQIRMVRDSFDH